MKLSAGLKAILAECEAACELCVSSCLTEGGAMSCCNPCRDCADLCALTFAFDSRRSQHFKEVMKICLDACKICEAECEKHQEMHEHCRVCAVACKACADACLNELENK